MVFVLPELGSAFQPYVINRSDAFALAAAFVCPAALLFVAVLAFEHAVHHLITGH